MAEFDRRRVLLNYFDTLERNDILGDDEYGAREELYMGDDDALFAEIDNDLLRLRKYEAVNSFTAKEDSRVQAGLQVVNSVIDKHKDSLGTSGTSLWLVGSMQYGDPVNADLDLCGYRATGDRSVRSRWLVRKDPFVADLDSKWTELVNYQDVNVELLTDEELAGHNRHFTSDALGYATEAAFDVFITAGKIGSVLSGRCVYEPSSGALESHRSSLNSLLRNTPLGRLMAVEVALDLRESLENREERRRSGDDYFIDL